MKRIDWSDVLWVLTGQKFYHNTYDCPVCRAERERLWSPR